MSVSVLTKTKTKRGTRTRTGKKTARASKSANGMARLEAATHAGDETAFLDARRAIDWSKRSAKDFCQAVRWALEAGAYRAATLLATEGAERFPRHAELAKMARILAPPKVIRSDLPPDPSIAADMDWLRAHYDEYRGQWIALRNGQLLGTANSRSELADKIGDIRGVLLAPVY
jgi:hypothetical protein